MSRQVHQERRERRARRDPLRAIAEESRPSTGIVLPTDTRIGSQQPKWTKSNNSYDKSPKRNQRSPITEKKSAKFAGHMVPRNSSKCRWQYEQGHLEVHLILKLDNVRTCPS